MFRTARFASAAAVGACRPSARMLSTTAVANAKLVAPPMVFIKGEEMTRYATQLMLDQWFEPHLDTTAWQYYDLSCANRDATEDQVLHDAIAAGADVKAIFKEPTVTPTEVQRKEMGLKKAWGSPNGAMRRGWNGITISRDTIHIDGLELGFSKPVLFERHAVGGEYGAGYDVVGRGQLTTVFRPENGGDDVVVDTRTLADDTNAVVTYSNPLDNVTDLAHHFFKRCLNAGVTPYIVTKKTVFKWQEGFWTKMNDVFEQHYKQQFLDAGLLDDCHGELQHLISDAATMQIIRWTGGGFGMAAHNYDGDMLTDQIAQMHRSPGFINSCLTGKAANGDAIREFEASHGTVADLYHAHLRGEETSLNPLGLVEALIGSIQHSCLLYKDDYPDSAKVHDFTEALRKQIHLAFVTGAGTRDLCGPSGLTTEQFMAHIAAKLRVALDGIEEDEVPTETVHPVVNDSDVDDDAMLAMFKDLDLDGNGVIDYDEFRAGLVRLNVHPHKHGF